MQPPKPHNLSAGLLMCRRGDADWEFLLVHPGGPFFAKKDDGAWSIPKGLPEADEDLLATARREFREETSFDDSAECYIPLGDVLQNSGKRVFAWAFEATCDPHALRSNTFQLEWPPRSGTLQPFPEVDRAAFFDAATAKRKILPAQAPFIDRALAALR
jgi:predicted NUDIX family NTP pyrophosphohydrolase